MTNRSGASGRTRLLLLAVAISIGACITVGQDLIHAAATDYPLRLGESWRIWVFQTTWAAMPFMALAVLGITNRWPWIVGLTLTLLLWGFFIYDTVSNWETGRGANIGLGLILILSPGVIMVACLITAWKTETRDS